MFLNILMSPLLTPTLYKPVITACLLNLLKPARAVFLFKSADGE